MGLITQTKGGSEITAAHVHWPCKRQLQQDRAVVLDMPFLNPGAKHQVIRSELTYYC